MNIPKDKQLHFAAGAMISLVGFFIAHHFFSDFNGCALVGFLLSLVAGLLKEFYDLLNRETHTPDLYDAIWTMLGGATVFCLVLLSKSWFF